MRMGRQVLALSGIRNMEVCDLREGASCMFTPHGCLILDVFLLSSITFCGSLFLYVHWVIENATHVHQPECNYDCISAELLCMSDCSCPNRGTTSSSGNTSRRR